MSIFRACLALLACALVVPSVVYGDESGGRATAQAALLVERMKAFDTEGTLALTYTRFFEKKGIALARPKNTAEQVNKTLKSVGAKYTQFELKPPDEPFIGDNQLYIFIPYSCVMEIQGQRVLMEAFFIGVSENAGQDWKFLDGINATPENIRIVIPSYSGKPLPSMQTKLLE